MTREQQFGNHLKTLFDAGKFNGKWQMRKEIAHEAETTEQYLSALFNGQLPSQPKISTIFRILHALKVSDQDANEIIHGFQDCFSDYDDFAAAQQLSQTKIRGESSRIDLGHRGNHSVLRPIENGTGDRQFVDRYLKLKCEGKLVEDNIRKRAANKKLDKNQAILFAGPSGSGKTLLALDVAHSRASNGSTAFFSPNWESLSEETLIDGIARHGEGGKIIVFDDIHVNPRKVDRIIHRSWFLFPDNDIEFISTSRTGQIYSELGEIDTYESIDTSDTKAISRKLIENKFSSFGGLPPHKFQQLLHLSGNSLSILTEILDNLNRPEDFIELNDTELCEIWLRNIFGTSAVNAPNMIKFASLAQYDHPVPLNYLNIDEMQNECRNLDGILQFTKSPAGVSFNHSTLAELTFMSLCFSHLEENPNEIIRLTISEMIFSKNSDRYLKEIFTRMVGTDLSLSRRSTLLDGLFDDPQVARWMLTGNRVKLQVYVSAIQFSSVYKNDYERHLLSEMLAMLSGVDGFVFDARQLQIAARYLRNREPAKLSQLEKMIPFERLIALLLENGGFIDLLRVLACFRPEFSRRILESISRSDLLNLVINDPDLNASRVREFHRLFSILKKMETSENITIHAVIQNALREDGCVLLIKKMKLDIFELSIFVISLNSTYDKKVCNLLNTDDFEEMFDRAILRGSRAKVYIWAQKVFARRRHAVFKHMFIRYISKCAWAVSIRSSDLHGLTQFLELAPKSRVKEVWNIANVSIGRAEWGALVGSASIFALAKFVESAQRHATKVALIELMREVNGSADEIVFRSTWYEIHRSLGALKRIDGPLKMDVLVNAVRKRCDLEIGRAERFWDVAEAVSFLSVAQNECPSTLGSQERLIEATLPPEELWKYDYQLLARFRFILQIVGSRSRVSQSELQYALDGAHKIFVNTNLNSCTSLNLWLFLWNIFDLSLDQRQSTAREFEKKFDELAIRRLIEVVNKRIEGGGGEDIFENTLVLAGLFKILFPSMGDQISCRPAKPLNLNDVEKIMRMGFIGSVGLLVGASHVYDRPISFFMDSVKEIDFQELFNRYDEKKSGTKYIWKLLQDISH